MARVIFSDKQEQNTHHNPNHSCIEEPYIGIQQPIHAYCYPDQCEKSRYIESSVQCPHWIFPFPSFHREYPDNARNHACLNLSDQICSYISSLCIDPPSELRK